MKTTAEVPEAEAWVYRMAVKLVQATSINFVDNIPGIGLTVMLSALLSVYLNTILYHYPLRDVEESLQNIISSLPEMYARLHATEDPPTDLADMVVQGKA